MLMLVKRLSLITKVSFDLYIQTVHNLAFVLLSSTIILQFGHARNGIVLLLSRYFGEILHTS